MGGAEQVSYNLDNLFDFQGQTQTYLNEITRLCIFPILHNNIRHALPPRLRRIRPLLRRIPWVQNRRECGLLARRHGVRIQRADGLPELVDDV